jgi:uncharacterized membrane protein
VGVIAVNFNQDFTRGYENILNSTTVFDYKYIRMILKDCPNPKDLMLDENGVITNPLAISYFNKILTSLLDPANMSGNYMRVLRSHMNSNIQEMVKNQNINKLYLMVSLYSAVFEYTSKLIRKKQSDNLSIVSIVFNHLIIAALSLFHGISILHSGGFFYSVIPQIRTLYENSVIFLYIHKYQNLAQAFFDHGEATQLFLMETMKPLDANSLSRKNSLIAKYGDKDFLKPYGWTKEIITKKEHRKIGTLAEDVDMGNATPFYKHLSTFIHSDSFSVNSFIKVDAQYLSPYISMSSFLLNKVIFYYMEIDEIPEIHRICIGNILDKITKLLFMPSLFKGETP